MQHDEGKETMALEPDYSLDHFATSVILCKSVVLGAPFLQMGVIIPMTSGYYEAY